jgi:hypothetical protein
MKYFLFLLACLLICQGSFCQNNLSENEKTAQIKKDRINYAEFQKKEKFYREMPEYNEAHNEWKLKNFEKELDLLKAAVAKGNPLAEERLGRIYEKGEGVQVNVYEAIKWYEMAADHGNMYALSYLSEVYDTDNELNIDKVRYFNTLLRCVDAGCEKCFAYLAIAYQYGGGTDADYSKALYYYKKGAEKGDYVDMLSIAGLYYKGGKNLSQSKEEAFKWYMKAATLNSDLGKPFPGSKKAMYQLYKMYNAGEGIKKNPSEGFKWLLKLSTIKEKQNSYEYEWMDDACYDLGNAYYTGVLVKQDYSEALRWFTLGAETKNPDGEIIAANKPCMEKLAIMYRDGLGVEKDSKLALEWYQKSKANKW